MDVFPVVHRLRAKVSAVNTVGAAAELDAAMRGYGQAPSIFVVPAAEKALQPGTAGACGGAGRTQLIEVISCVDQLSDPTGAAALHGLPTVRKQISAALEGWTPDERMTDPMFFVEGEIIQFEGDGLLWWSDKYACVQFGR